MSTNNDKKLKKMLTQKESSQTLYILDRSYTKEDESILRTHTENKVYKINQKSLFKISSTILEERKKIYYSKSIKEQISLCYNLILRNREEIKTLMEEKKLSNPSTDEESFKYFLDYF